MFETFVDVRIGILIRLNLVGIFICFLGMKYLNIKDEAGSMATIANGIIGDRVWK